MGHWNMKGHLPREDGRLLPALVQMPKAKLMRTNNLVSKDRWDGALVIELRQQGL